MSTRSEARRDAEEMARAEMFFGEGAGIRRRLIAASIHSKMDRSEEYARAYREEYAKQDMAEHASKARKERRRRDVSKSLTKDAKNLARGNYGNVQTGVLVLAVAGYLAHQSGYDKVVLEKGKELYGKAKQKVKNFRRPVMVFNQINCEHDHTHERVEEGK